MEIIAAVIWFVVIYRFYARARARSANVAPIYVTNMVEAGVAERVQTGSARRRGWA